MNRLLSILFLGLALNLAATAQVAAKQGSSQVRKSAAPAGKAVAPRKTAERPVATRKSAASTARVGKVSKSAKPAARRAVAGAKDLARGRVAVARPVVVAEPPRLSVGQSMGLHDSVDPLELKSSVALVVDAETNEVLFSKNPQAVLPIASITKLMTALLVLEARQPLDEVLTIAEADVDTEKNSSSRLVVGTQLTRGEMLHLALMSSENRAANALGRHFPGGLNAMVVAMNRRALAMGMGDTRFVEPTGLSSQNRSSARDLAVLVRESHRQPLMRELSTSQEAQVAVGQRVLQFHNTNGLVKSPDWEIGLQKTGYIAEAGRCLVMEARTAGRRLIMVLLDSAGKYSRIGDAERIRRWLDHASTDSSQGPVPLRRRAS